MGKSDGILVLILVYSRSKGELRMAMNVRVYNTTINTTYNIINSSRRVVGMKKKTVLVIGVIDSVIV